jgi:hypothetical protein
MKKLLLLAIVSTNMFCAEHENLWRASIATYAVANAVDIKTSLGGYEVNPVLGKGYFGVRQASIKVGIAGLSVFVQQKWFKHNRKACAIVNFTASGIQFGVAFSNWRRKHE